jgi:hypothetical protein
MGQPGGDLDLAQEPAAAESGGQVGPQHLDGTLASVADVVGQADQRHAAGAGLAFDDLAVGEGRPEAKSDVVHPVKLHDGPRLATWAGDGVPCVRLRDAGPVNPRSVTSIGFLPADETPGPFALEAA